MAPLRILVVAAHPDDEVIGCGGAIAVHTKKKDEICLLFMTDGVTSRGYDPDLPYSREEELKEESRVVAERQKESLKAAAALGVPSGNVIHLAMADQRLDMYPFLDLVKRVEKVKDSFKPDIVYTHFMGDLNLDHRLTYQSVMTAFRRDLEKVYLFEIPESTQFAVFCDGKAFEPNHYVDVAAGLEVKMRALACYASEKRKAPDPRSEKALRELAVSRGYAAGMPAAEAFVHLSLLKGGR